MVAWKNGKIQHLNIIQYVAINFLAFFAFNANTYWETYWVIQ